MISYLKGKVLHKQESSIIILVANVGYKVFVSPTMIVDLVLGEEVELYTHQHVREDALDLFGFKDPQELGLFELLIAVSGIGPKTALNVLAVGSPAEIKNSISLGDSDFLTKVSGIGKKTAERVVLELRDKISVLRVNISCGDQSVDIKSTDDIDALMALGYSLAEAREALRRVDPKIVKTGDRIREALKNI